jgi:hypothetical protein
MSRRPCFCVLAAVWLGSCGGGNGSGTGLPRSATFAGLTEAQAARLCDWANLKQGGYGRTVTCSDGTQEVTHADNLSCVESIPYVAVACPTLTVADVENCVNAIGADLCQTTTHPACANLAACAGATCLPRIYIPWALESAAGAPVTCGTAGARYVGATVNTQPFEVDCPASLTQGTMSVSAAGPGSYTIVVSLLDSLRADVVPPTPPLTATVATSCADVTTLEAVFVIP